MSARLKMFAVSFCLSLPVIARAEAPTSPGWGLLLAGGGGLFAGNNSDNRGGLLSAHLLVMTRLDVEFGVALQWGRTFNTSQTADLDTWTPWDPLRVGTSTSTQIDSDAIAPRLYSSTHLALAAGAGMDVRIAGPLGVTLGGYYQSCDINTKPGDAVCLGAGPTLVLNPHLRF